MNGRLACIGLPGGPASGGFGGFVVSIQEHAYRGTIDDFFVRDAVAERSIDLPRMPAYPAGILSSLDEGMGCFWAAVGFENYNLLKK